MCQVPGSDPIAIRSLTYRVYDNETCMGVPFNSEANGDGLLGPQSFGDPNNPESRIACINDLFDLNLERRHEAIRSTTFMEKIRC